MAGSRSTGSESGVTADSGGHSVIEGSGSAGSTDSGGSVLAEGSGIAGSEGGVTAGSRGEVMVGLGI